MLFNFFKSHEATLLRIYIIVFTIPPSLSAIYFKCLTLLTIFSE